MLGFGLLAFGVAAFIATLLFIRWIYGREASSSMARAEELERRLALTRAEKRLLEEEVRVLQRRLDLFDEALRSQVTTSRPDRRPGSS